MNKLQVCVSAEATLQKVDECAQGHDKKVKQWIASQVEYLNCKCVHVDLYKSYDSD